MQNNACAYLPAASYAAMRCAVGSVVSLPKVAFTRLTSRSVSLVALGRRRTSETPALSIFSNQYYTFFRSAGAIAPPSWVQRTGLPITMPATFSMVPPGRLRRYSVRAWMRHARGRARPLP